jgi:hypothetical protein
MPDELLELAAVHRSEAETLDMEKPVLALIGKGQSMPIGH